jgi:hypothetical protein
VVQGGRARDTFPKHTSDVLEQGCGSDESEGRPEGKYFLGREVHKESKGNVGEKLVHERGVGSRDFISKFFEILMTMARQTYYRG